MHSIVLVFIVLIITSNSLADKGYFWHVTDFHYDQTYWTSQLACNEEVPHPGTFGDYWCDSPWRLVQDTVENMAKIKADVDFVIWTGDTIAHIKNENLTLAKNMEVLTNVTRLLQETFSDSVPFYPTLGNHDFYPNNQADVVADDNYKETSKLWSQWIDDADQLKQFALGGFYHKEIRPNLRLLALNTNLYFTANKITKGKPDPAGQFKWMEAALAQAKTDGEKVIVIGHVGPGIRTPGAKDWMYAQHQEKLINILTKYSDIIVATHYGHDHSDGFKIIEDSMNVLNYDARNNGGLHCNECVHNPVNGFNQNTISASKAIPQFIAPSVTPNQYMRPPRNPGVRLIEYERDTGRHINYVQYFTNLTDANANGKTSWKPLYDFSKSYGVKDMSVESLRDIFSRMGGDSGMQLAQKYCNYAQVSTYDQYCPDKYRWEIICGGRFYDMKKTLECVKDNLAGNAVVLGANLSIYCLIFLIGVLV